MCVKRKNRWVLCGGADGNLNVKRKGKRWTYLLRDKQRYEVNMYKGKAEE